jgi:hypothetical protein
MEFRLWICNFSGEFGSVSALAIGLVLCTLFIDSFPIVILDLLECGGEFRAKYFGIVLIRSFWAVDV